MPGVAYALKGEGFLYPLSFYFILAFVDPCCVTHKLCLYNSVLLFALFPDTLDPGGGGIWRLQDKIHGIENILKRQSALG